MVVRSPRRWPRRLAPIAALFLAAGNLGMSCGPPPPTPEICDLPGPVADGAITSVEIGQVVNGQFTPFTDGAIAPVVYGGQGAPMIVAQLRIRGTGVPACLAQETHLERLDGLDISSLEAGIETTPIGPGVWLGGEMYLVYYGPVANQVRLRAQVEDQSVSVVVWADAVGTIDAGVDGDVDAP
jgi:hypothetical protein